MSRIHRLLVFLVLFLASASLPLHAQTYQWHLALRGDFRSVAFNPRSNGHTIFAGPHGTGGIWRSDDGGMSWSLDSNGLVFPADVPIQDVHQILCIPSDTNIVLAVTPRQLYRSTDGGVSWSDTSSLGGVDGETICYHDADSIIYYAQNGIFPLTTWESIDLGLTWIPHPIIQGGGYSALCALAVSSDIPPVLLSGSGDSALIERSTDAGSTWETVAEQDNNLSLGAEIPKIVFSDHATNDAHDHGIAYVTRWLSRERSILQTTDDGQTWTTVNSPNRYVWALDLNQRSDMLGQSGNASYTYPLQFWTGIFGQRSDTVQMVQETTDGGASWHGTNFPSFAGSADTLIKQVWVLKYDTLSGKIAVATDAGIFVADTKSGVKQASPVNDAVDISQSDKAILIDAADKTIHTIELYDILGRLVYQAGPEERTYQIATSNFTFGVYLLEVNSSNGPPSLKLLTLP